MRRIILGLLALTFLIGGLIALPIWDPADAQENYVPYFGIKIGLVLGAIWLAMPQVESLITRTPPWLWAVLGMGLLAAVFSKSFFIILPLIAAICLVQFVGWMFKPPSPKKRTGSPSRSRSSSDK